MKSTLSKFLTALAEGLITAAILTVIFVAFTSCSPDSSESTPPGTLTLESYDYQEYNYQAGIGKQYNISATLKNETAQTKTGVVIFDFTQDGTRPNDLTLEYSIAPGTTQTFTNQNPVFISTGASLLSVYIQ